MGMVGWGQRVMKCLSMLTKIHLSPRNHCRRGEMHHANITRATLKD